MTQVLGRVHRVRNEWGEGEEWVECTPEEWERAAAEERIALGLGGLQQFEPVRVRRACVETPLWDIRRTDGWVWEEIGADNPLAAVAAVDGLGVMPEQLEMRVGRHAVARWLVSRAGEPAQVFSVRERW